MKLNGISNPILISSNSFTDGKDAVKNCLSIGVGGVVTKTIYIGNISKSSSEKIYIVGNNVYNSCLFSRFSGASWLHWFKHDFRNNQNIIPSLYGENYNYVYEYIEELVSLGVNKIEIGISCPSYERGFSFDHCCTLIEKIKAKYNIQVLVKLCVSEDIVQRIKELAYVNIDGITLSDSIQEKVYWENVLYEMGGSGAKIKPMVTKSISKVRELFPNLIILGVGGIQSVQDISDYFSIGCNYVQLCSVLYVFGIKHTKKIILDYLNLEK